MKSVYSSHSFGGRGPVRRSGFSEAPVTKWLMIVLAVFLVIDVTGRNELSSGTLMPYLELDDGLLIQLWRWVSYPFVSLHLGEWLFSMIVLFSFGKTLEPVLNSRRFAVLLGITTIVGSMIYAILLTTSQSPLTGSSGWAVAILVAVALLNPNQEVQLLIPPVPLKIKHLVGGLIVIMVVMAIAQRQDPAVTLAQLSAIGVSFLCMKNRHWLDLGINSKKGQKRSKSVQSRFTNKKIVKEKAKGMKARTILNMKASKREEEINKILDKVSAEGIGNLTEDEREILKFASKK